MQQIRACPRCASQEVRGLTLQEGLVAGGGETLRYVCPECNFQGAPVLFDAKEDYEAFRLATRGPPGEEVSAKEAGARSDAEAEAAEEEARGQPLPPLPDSKGTMDRLRIMPLFAFAAGGLLLVFGALGALSNLVAAQAFSPLGVVANVIYALVGLAFILIGKRAWDRAATG